MDSYVYLLDIFPTLCELFGLPIPASVEGKSFAGMFANPAAKIREDLYFVYNDLIRSVKNERYKLIEYCGFAQRTQLFDLYADPAEINDLSGDPDHRETVRLLRGKMAEYRKTWESGGHAFSRRYWSAYDESVSGPH